MVIFHSYVKLPEGTTKLGLDRPGKPWKSSQQTRRTSPSAKVYPRYVISETLARRGLRRVPSESYQQTWGFNRDSIGIWVCLKMSCTPLYPMVLLIIIPMKNGYFIGNINPTFSDKPIFGFTTPDLDRDKPRTQCHLPSLPSLWIFLQEPVQTFSNPSAEFGEFGCAFFLGQDAVSLHRGTLLLSKNDVGFEEVLKRSLHIWKGSQNQHHQPWESTP